ncbi:MAG: beta-N-acetylhexosaminidase [Oligoflexia bacterium]
MLQFPNQATPSYANLMSSLQAAKQAVGELLMMGFSGNSKGLELDASTAAFIRDAQVGGVILFSHNYESPAQVAELINQVQSCRTQLPLWVSVDHEGGKVQRFKKPFTRIPEAALVAESGSPQLAFEIATLMARELKSVGINLNFSPIADINTNPKNPVIGRRSYGESEDQVSKFVSAIVRGHLTQRVQPCLKHFPGHGDTTVDSHYALPRVTTPIETLRNREFRPFQKGFKSGCNFVMTAHILFPHLDAQFPATLSKQILRPFLREELRYRQIIVSDDMEMQAITDHYGAEEAPRLAIEAGCDLLIYRSEAAARTAHSALVSALDSGKLDPELVLTAAERSRSLKKEVLLPYRDTIIADVMKGIATPEHAELMAKLEAGTKAGSKS